MLTNDFEFSSLQGILKWYMNKPVKIQDGELADGRRCLSHHHVSIADADDEIDHHGHSRKEDAARHALTVEHEEEGEIDERRTRLALQDDEHHG